MKRIPALDAARGLLACLVVAHHFCAGVFGCNALDGVAHFAVLCFFVMSGYVLARAYDGNVTAFIVRRIARLWPLYAACLTVGYALLGGFAPVAEYAWWPMPEFRHTPIADPPAWSLYMEAWATPAFPILFGVAARGRVWILLATLCSFSLIALEPRLYCVPFFAGGVALAQFSVPWPKRIPGWAVWLGDISYSLYLTHDLALMAFGAWGLTLVLPVAWVCWWAIERPSIKLSRMIASSRNPTQPAPSGLPA